MGEIITRYCHFIGIFLLVASLLGELMLIELEMSRKQFRKLSLLDSMYGMGAMIALIAGLILWFGVGKPSTYYTHNIVFHIKLGLFIVIGLLSIVPTVFFIKNRKGDAEIIQIPRHVIGIIKLQVALVPILPLLAVMMARGIGYSE